MHVKEFTGLRWAAFAVGTTVISGGMLAVHPIATIAAVLGIAAVPLLLRNAPARLAVVLVGALMVFQSSQDVGPAKLAYLALVGLCVTVSTIQVAKLRNSAIGAFRLLLPATAAMAAAIALSALVAYSNGNQFSDWIRDVMPYGLLTSLPVVGLDASGEVTPSVLEKVIGILSVIGAVALAIDWVNRRDVSSLAVGRILLSTPVLVAFGFALAITRGGLGPRRMWWLLAALVIVISMLVSGSRTNLVLLVGFFGVVGARRKGRISPLRASQAIVITSMGAVLLLPWLASRIIDDPEFLSSRIEAAQAVLNGEAAADQSFIIRRQQYIWVAEQFRAHIWMGTGPGFRYPNGVFTQDTPLLVPAKFGLIGLSVMMAYLVVLTICIRRSRKLTGYLPIHTAVRAWVVILVSLTPFGPWLEDKGLALTVTMLVAAVAAHNRQSSGWSSEEPEHLVRVTQRNPVNSI